MGKRGPKGNKAATLSARITVATRQRLDAAAKASGLSLSQEVERRLRLSLDDQDTFGGPVTSWMLESIAGGMTTIERHTGRKWEEDPYTFDECRSFVDAWMARFRPDGAATAPQPISRLALIDPTPPSKIALQNSVSVLLLLSAALKTGIDLPVLQATAARVLGTRMKLTKKQQDEIGFLRQQLASGAITLNFGGEK